MALAHKRNRGQTGYLLGYLALVVIEVVPHSRWASALVVSLGHEILVANAARVALIHQSDRKNSRLDARHLAKLARVDPSLSSPITHRDGTSQTQ